MIVVIVRQQHHVERRQLADRRRDGMESLWASEGEWRRARAEHWIGEDAHAVDFDDERAVPEPGDAQAGRRNRRRPHRNGILHWNGDAWFARAPAKKRSRMTGSVLPSSSAVAPLVL